MSRHSVHCGCGRRHLVDRVRIQGTFKPPEFRNLVRDDEPGAGNAVVEACLGCGADVQPLIPTPWLPPGGGDRRAEQQEAVAS